MRILIISDAWYPQVNGVVRTLRATQTELEKKGHTVCVLGPDLTRWATISVPTYAEISLELFSFRRLSKAIDLFKPDSLHIATEGPLGWTARWLCLLRGWTFTTAYHTRFPEYMSARAPTLLRRMAVRLSYAVLRHFHNRAACVMVPTHSMQRVLRAQGFRNVVLWSRGVDTDLFNLQGKYCAPYQTLTRPILLYVGRVSVEKNIEAFLSLQTNGTKVVVGEGPDKATLTAAYPDAVFLGKLEAARLSQAYAAADLFVFPSRSDTFGLVLLEACAAGLRIAAYAVAGPKDIFEGPEAASFVALDSDLQRAVERALALPESPQGPRHFAQQHSWAVATGQFFDNLYPLTSQKPEK